MATSISNTAAIAMLNALTAQLNIGGAGHINLYSFSPPDFVDDPVPVDAVLLATCNLSNPAFAPAVDAIPNAKATANAITASVGLADGTLGWYRAFNGAGIAVIQGIVGVEMIVTAAGVVIGAPVSVVSWVINQREM